MANIKSILLKVFILILLILFPIIFTNITAKKHNIIKNEIEINSEIANKIFKNEFNYFYIISIFCYK